MIILQLFKKSPYFHMQGTKKELKVLCDALKALKGEAEWYSIKSEWQTIAKLHDQMQKALGEL